MAGNMVTLPEPESDRTQKRRLRHSAICRTVKALAILSAYMV